MNCPLCLHPESMVIRTTEGDQGIRRIRKCKRCGHRWPTMEIGAGEAVKLRKLADVTKGILTGSE